MNKQDISVSHRILNQVIALLQLGIRTMLSLPQKPFQKSLLNLSVQIQEIDSTWPGKTCWTKQQEISIYWCLQQIKSISTKIWQQPTENCLKVKKRLQLQIHLDTIWHDFFSQRFWKSCYYGFKPIYSGAYTSVYRRDDSYYWWCCN